MKGSKTNTMVQKMAEYFSTCGDQERILDEYVHLIVQLRDLENIQHVRFGTGERFVVKLF